MGCSENHHSKVLEEDSHSPPHIPELAWAPQHLRSYIDSSFHFLFHYPYKTPAQRLEPLCREIIKTYSSEMPIVIINLEL